MSVLTLAAYAGAALAFVAAEDADVCINERLSKTFVCKEDQFCCGERCCPRTLLTLFWVMGGIVILIITGLTCLCRTQPPARERTSLVHTERGNVETAPLVGSQSGSQLPRYV